MSDYFSDREFGHRPRTEQEVSPAAWAGIVVLVEALANKCAFGLSFPKQCPDGSVICGCNTKGLKGAIEAEIHGLSWPLQTEEVIKDEFLSSSTVWCPSTLTVLDFVEFTWRVVAQPICGKYHDYFQHHHLTFDQDSGRASFREDVNRILARNRMAYELGEDGKVRRLLPAVISEALSRTYFRTGEATLDVMLEESRAKFSDPNPLMRREALERLFDSWERIKSLADTNKARSIQLILDNCASEPVLRDVLENEARELTKIGNSHLLRHHEVKQIPVIDVHYVDYLYHRLFALIELVIRKNATS